MKPKSRFASYVFGAMLILSAILGVYIANRIYQYEIMVKGILGIVVLYLQFFYIRFSGIEVSTDRMLSDPNKKKYIFYAFIAPGIAYWVAGFVLDMSFLVVGKLVELLK
jgi:hypothetical protein